MKEETAEKLSSIKINTKMVFKTIKLWKSSHYIGFVFKYDFFIKVRMLALCNLVLLFLSELIYILFFQFSVNKCK